MAQDVVRPVLVSLSIIVISLDKGTGNSVYTHFRAIHVADGRARIGMVNYTFYSELWTFLRYEESHSPLASAFTVLHVRKLDLLVVIGVGVHIM